jgi:hypothetical protein
VLSDLRYAFRQLVKNPGFTVVALLTLALGIGVNTTMFSVLNALVLQASHAREPSRMVAVFRTSPQSQEWPHSPANFYDYQRQNTSFEQLAAFSWTNFNLAETGQPAERLSGCRPPATSSRSSASLRPSGGCSGPGTTRRAWARWPS